MTYFEKEGQKEEHKENLREHHHEKSKDSCCPTGLNRFQKFLTGVVIVQVLLLVFIAYKMSAISGIAVDQPTGNAIADTIPQARPSAPVPSAVPSVDMTKLVDDDTILGDKNAPVTIVEFSDYECPFCERFYSQTFGQIEDKYIKTGKVKFVYRDFPLSFHANAQKAAEAAECAGEQGKYFEMNKKLFEGGVSGGVTSFKQYASDIGLDKTEFNTCLDSGTMAPEVQKDFIDGQKAGVSGTPAFFINGKLLTGAQPFSAFKQIIDGELA